MGYKPIEWRNARGTGFYAVLVSGSVPFSVSIGCEAFYDCSSLTSVTIPDSVTTIGIDAFEDCSSLTTVTYTGDLKSWCEIEGLLMCDITSNKTLTIGGMEITGNLIIPDSVTNIGEEAFYDCYSLESIIIPNSVTSIDYGAFRYCSSLTSVTIGSGVISIGGGAFGYCKKLTSVIIPDNVESIGYEAFMDCTSLTNVMIGNGVTYIGSTAFSRCSSLENITIGNSVTNIDQMAFYGGNVTKGNGWNSEVPATKVVCTDGEVTL